MQHILKRTLTFTELVDRSNKICIFIRVFFLKKTHANEDSTITDLTKHIKLKGI